MCPIKLINKECSKGKNSHGTEVNKSRNRGGRKECRRREGEEFVSI